MAPPPGVRSSPDHLPPPHSSPGNCVTVVCKRTDGLPMKSLSPWTVDDKLRPLSTRPLDAELTTNGQDLRIRADDRQHARLLTEITESGQVPVTITTTTNTTQGSIWAPELDLLDADVILQGFASQGVTAVYRPPRGPKALLLVTIEGSTLPHRLQAGYLMYEVRVVVPKPRRCAHCQRYGHQAAKCRSGVVCEAAPATAHRQIPTTANTSNTQTDSVPPVDSQVLSVAEEAETDSIPSEDSQALSVEEEADNTLTPASPDPPLCDPVSPPTIPTDYDPWALYPSNQSEHEDDRDSVSSNEPSFDALAGRA